MAKRKMFNVRSTLERIIALQEGIEKYGYCPAIQDELASIAFCAKGALKKATGRKDLRLEAHS